MRSSRPLFLPLQVNRQLAQASRILLRLLVSTDEAGQPGGFGLARILVGVILIVQDRGRRFCAPVCDRCDLIFAVPVDLLVACGRSSDCL